MPFRRHPADPQALQHRGHRQGPGHRHRHPAHALHRRLVHRLLGGRHHTLHGAALLPLPRHLLGTYQIP